MQASGTPSTRNCVGCGRAIPWDANVCQYCGHDYRVPAASTAPKEKGIMPVIGGILILIGGLIEILGGVALMGSVGALDSLMPVDVEGVEAVEDFLTACGAIFVILGIIGVLGGVMGILRKSWGLAILGGIFALPGWFIPALVGLILVGISRKDFD